MRGAAKTAFGKRSLSVTMSEEEVVFRTRGALGIIHLNRPRSLNALTREMCVAIRERLEVWKEDGTVAAVLIEGEGDRAFCAGGDVVRVARAAQEGRDDWWQFFFDEYRMNSAIAHFPKPYVAFIDGITMGGGVGVSVHGDYRVATERTLFAMPETGLGLIPDVGGTHVLPRLPGATGIYLALTGYRARAADCCYLGVATHFVPSEGLTALRDGLETEAGTGSDAVRALLDTAAADPGTAPLAAHRDAIDRHFSLATVEEILDSLATDASEWAVKTRKELLTKSPTSLKLSLAALRRGATRDLDECLRMEYRIVHRIMTLDKDFFEGVRALLIDKDKAPNWQPARLADVDDAVIEAHFADLGDAELRLP